MTLQEVMQLPVARVCHDGNPRCFACAPIRGDHPNQFVDFDAGTTMAIDPERPAVCICPQCGAKAQTPSTLAIDILTQQVSALKEQLARDPIAQAMVSGRIAPSECFLLPHERLYQVRQPDGVVDLPNLRIAIRQLESEHGIAAALADDVRKRLLADARAMLSEAS